MTSLKESIHICGLIRARAVPFSSREEWDYWWLVERDLSGHVIGPARMSEREKNWYTVAEEENILVAAGITQLLSYLGSNSGNATAFAQQFAVGNIAIANVTTGDTSIAGEFFRAAPSLASVSGIQQDLSTFLGTTQGVGNVTNAGLYGGSASSTPGSGVLYTHSPFTYNKVNGLAITYDYCLSYI